MAGSNDEGSPQYTAVFWYHRYLDQKVGVGLVLICLALGAWLAAETFATSSTPAGNPSASDAVPGDCELGRSVGIQVEHVGVGAPYGTSITSLSRAIRDGDLFQLQKALDDGVGLDQWEGVGDDGIVAYCVREGLADLARVLLDEGADSNRIGYEGASPLHLAVAMRNSEMVLLLINAGADPNQPFPRPVTPEFLSLTEKKTMQWFLKHERRVTPLMMVLNDGDLAMIKALVDSDAERYVRSGRYQLYPLNFASRRSDVKAMQVMLGVDPADEKHHVEVDLSDQRVLLYNAQKEVLLRSQVSTGKAGHRTPTGEFVITDKHRSHRSTIYNVKMPYFQRLSCSAIGFHSGYVPGYAASHGCIRMPAPAAKKLFELAPVGTRVVIQD